MADVFISYSTGKADNTVQQIADALDRVGISCWYMGRDSRYGRFPEKIAEEIESCEVFLLVLNETSNQSKHVQNEVSLAFENDKELLLFHVDGCKLSHYMRYYLNSFARMDANPPTEQRIQELVEQIADILGKTPPKTHHQEQTSTKETPPQNPETSAKIIKLGSCGTDVAYKLDETGVLMIAGNGNMKNYTHNGEIPWWNEREMIRRIRVKQGVTSIGVMSFMGCVNLTSIVIPDSVTGIGFGAFSGCKNLTSASIPAHLDIRYTFPDNTVIFRRSRK